MDQESMSLTKRWSETAGRREDLLSMRSTVTLEAKLDLASGRSAWYR